MHPILANIVLEFFLKGGPVMWPILASAIVAVAVVGERAFWWWRESRTRDPQKMEQLLAALENSDVPAAQKISEGSDDPVIRMIRHGLGHVGHVHASLLGALQLAAGVELKRAGRFLTVMDTLVTLAPLLGLLGTVTGLMRAFLHIGSEELSVTAVTGGIGEALIATACGLGVPDRPPRGRLKRSVHDAGGPRLQLGAGKAGDAVHLHKPEASRTHEH